MKKETKDALIGALVIVLIGLNAIGLTSGGTRFASVNDFAARHAAMR